MASNELYGTEAQQQAKEWGYDDEIYKGDLDKVTMTRKSSRIGCRWVWEGDKGCCLACGDVDSELFDEDDD